jgi:hypothetical protein
VGTAAPPPDDELEAFDEDDDGFDERELEEDFPDVEDIAAGDPVDPAMRPVIEAGGGVSEGFELAEAELIEHASLGPEDGTELVFEDAPPVEAEPDRATYAEADHELVEDDD